MNVTILKEGLASGFDESHFNSKVALGMEGHLCTKVVSLVRYLILGRRCTQQ